VILGSLGTDPAAVGADAVVSLCQVGWADFPAIPPRDHLQIWLADGPGDNNNPHYVIDQAARVGRYGLDRGFALSGAELAQDTILTLQSVNAIVVHLERAGKESADFHDHEDFSTL
jgi:hypothetical protein